MSKMMRISEQTSKNLAQLAKVTGKSKQAILEKVLEVFTREQFLKVANEAYAKQKKDKKSWQQEQEELHEWDITLYDGLSDE